MGHPKVLITGARGRIGKILISHLADSFDLCGLDRCTSDDDPYVVADVSDFEQVQAAFERVAPLEYVIHLAGDSNEKTDWESALKNNIHGTRNVFEASNRTRVRRVVFASSNHVTGAYEGTPPTLHRQTRRALIGVKDPVRPDGPYGISKVAGEAIARYYFDCHKLEAICLRIGSVLQSDDPTQHDRDAATWLSYGDLVRLIQRALLATDRFPGFGIYYGVSNNSKCFWNIENAKDELGFEPQDNAADRQAAAN